MSLTKKATDPYTYHSEYLLCSTNLYKNHIAYLNLKLSTQDTCNQCTWDEFKFTLKSESMVLNWCASSGRWWRMSSEPMKMLSRWAQVLCTSSHSNSTESARVSWACSSNTCPWKNAAAYCAATLQLHLREKHIEMHIQSQEPPGSTVSCTVSYSYILWYKMRWDDISWSCLKG